MALLGLGMCRRAVRLVGVFLPEEPPHRRLPHVQQPTRLAQGHLARKNPFLDHGPESGKFGSPDYHSQFLAEQNWRFIKVPWHLSPVFLKLNRRVEAFAYVLLLALIVHRMIQHRVRALLETSSPKKMLLPGGIWRSTPTTEQLLDMLARVAMRFSVDQHGMHHHTFSRLRPEIRRSSNSCTLIRRSSRSPTRRDL